MEKKSIIITVIVIILLIVAGYLGGLYTLLGRQASFNFERMDCLGDTRECRINGYIADSRVRGYGENRIYGTIDALPKCGQYTLSGYFDGGNNKCSYASTHIKLYINDIEVLTAYEADYTTASGYTRNGGFISAYNGQLFEKTESLSGLDVTNIINGKALSTVKVVAQAVDAQSDTYVCGVSFNSLAITSYECEGDRYFTSSCPLWSNYSIKGVEFKSGSNVSMSDFPSDAYFCKSQLVIIKDSNNRIVGNSAQALEDLNNGKKVQVPQGQSYIFIFASASQDSRVQNLNIIIDNLNLDLQSKIDAIKTLNLEIEQYNLLISKREMTITAMEELVTQLNLKAEGLMQLINEYDAKILSAEANVLQLKQINEQLLLDVVELQNNAADRARLLELAYNQNAELGKALSQVKLDNQEYADTISAIAGTLIDDKDILTGMDLKNDDLVDIVARLKIDYEDMKQLLKDMSDNLADEKVLTAQLKDRVGELEQQNEELKGLLDNAKTMNSNLKVLFIILAIGILGYGIYRWRK